MDFLSDSLFNGWRFRALIEVDNYIRECLAIHAGQALKGEDVVSIMDALRGLDKRLPVRIQTDNGTPEYSLVPVAGRCTGQTRQVPQGI